MTSIERKEARYKRRKEKREKKRLDLLETYNFDLISNPDSLYTAATESRCGVFWKASVQRYNMSILRNSIKLSKDIRNGSDVRKGFIEFHVVERGKTRHIRSVHFSERVVQKSLCKNLLIPLLTRSLIHDNGASISNKGITFAVKRLKTHLTRHYREHGLNGYVVLVDFKGYFASILHEGVYEMYKKAFGEDEKALNLAMQFVYAFGDRGLGLGSEISQVSAVAYPNSIDHFIKQVLKCKYYGRYMDDSYIICESKEHANNVLNTLLGKYDEKGITVNQRKSSIVKLTRGFTFLKTQFSLTDTGKIIMRPCHESAVRQRRKLKKFKKFLDADKMTMKQIHQSYISWRGFIAHKNARRTIHSMDRLYQNLFNIHPLAG